MLLELGYDHFRSAGRDVETDADRPAGRREDRRIDADHFTVHVERWATRVTLVDRRVDLDVLVIGSRADIPTTSGDNAGGDCAAKTEGIADRDNPIADPGIVLRELHVSEVLVGIDLDQRKVSLRIDPDHLCVVSGSVIGCDLHRLGVVDDMTVSHRIAIRGDEEARAFAGDDLLALGSLGHAPKPELLEIFLERVSRRKWNCTALIVLLHAHLNRSFDLDLYR